MRYLGTIDGRNYVVTRLVAEIAENYYKLMGLDKRLETSGSNHRASGAKPARSPSSKKEFARGTELGVQRFLAEVRRNQSQKLIIRQEIIETENRINFLCRSLPAACRTRCRRRFFDLNLPTLSVGVPAQLLQNRPDIRQAERKLAAAGLDVRVARANFYPKLFITGRRWLRGLQHKVSVLHSGILDLQCRW